MYKKQMILTKCLPKRGFMKNRNFISGLGDTELVKIFNEAFAKVAFNNDISNFQTNVIRTAGQDSVDFEVDIFGMAGTPPMELFKNSLIKNEERSLLIKRDDKGVMQVDLVPDRTVFLNGNDYRITYRSK